MATVSLQSLGVEAKAGEGLSYVREGDEFPRKRNKVKRNLGLVFDVAREVCRRVLSKSDGELNLISVLTLRYIIYSTAII